MAAFNTSSPEAATVPALLLAGSNIGDRYANLVQARNHLHASGCILVKESSVYQTQAWGNTNQEDFLNVAWLVHSFPDPGRLLDNILSIERSMGRQRTGKWEPRLIDIDILLFGDLVMDSERLVVPHPRLPERRFALAPAVEIAPNWIHPVLKKSLAQLLAETTDPLTVSTWQP